MEGTVVHSQDKIEEASKVLIAFLTGLCDTCNFLSACSVDGRFVFTDDCPCMGVVLVD